MMVVADGVERSDIEIFHVEEAAQFLPDFTEQIFLVERRAEGAADFV